jgi:hypothetical protein
MRVSVLLVAALPCLLAAPSDIAAQHLTPQILRWERHFVVTSEVVVAHYGRRVATLADRLSPYWS